MSDATKAIRRSENDAPGFFVYDQDGQNTLYLTRDEDVLQADQASRNGFNASGSNGYASYLLYEHAQADDFVIEADITVRSFERATSQLGIFTGAFAEYEAEAGQFYSVGLRGDNSGRGFGFKGSDFGATGNSTITAGNTYQIVFKRQGNSLKGSISINGEVLLSESASNLNVTTQEDLQSGKLLYPGFAIVGVQAVVTNLRLTDSEGEVLFDSEEWKDESSQVPPVDWDEVPDPQLGEAVLTSDGVSVTMPWTMKIRYGYADEITVVMRKRGEQEVLGAVSYMQAAEEGRVSFTPAVSGSYEFSAEAVRAGEETAKKSNVVYYENYAPKQQRERADSISKEELVQSWDENPPTAENMGEFLDEFLFIASDAGNGSVKIPKLQVPVLAYDEKSIVLVWHKPEKYEDISDYAVYRDGERIGTAKENFHTHASWAAEYMDSFYAGYEDQEEIDMVQVDIHNFRVTGLQPSTEYEFYVRSLDQNGEEIEGSESGHIVHATTAAPEIFNITDFGAVATEGYVSYNDEINEVIEQNTKAIQTAVYACSKGGKVVIPEGIFVSGAIYLKSDMTLELQRGAVLWGSPNADHYNQNYLLYPYSTDTRSWALINAYSSDESEHGYIENIRITGEGTVYGNGWKYGTKDDIYGDGHEEYHPEQDRLDPEDEAYRLEEWVAGNNSKVLTYGVLAADASTKAQANGSTASEAYYKRPSLVVLRGIKGIYLEDFAAKNPAFHTVALLDSYDVVSNGVKYITYDCNNADGIEIGNTIGAMIFNNFYDTGDDSINFATGLGNGVRDSHQHPSDTVWTFNNFIRNGHGGAIAAGSHTGAGIGHMLVEDNVVNLNEMVFRFKSAPDNGGGVSNVYVRDCAISNCRQVFTFSTSYSDVNQVVSIEPADVPAEFSRIKAYRITADLISRNTIEISADVGPAYKPWHAHHDMYFQDMTLTNVGYASNSPNTPEYLKGAENIVFDNVKISSHKQLWPYIAYSKGLRFTGGTSIGDSGLPENAMSAPEWPEDTVAAAIAVSRPAASGGYAVASAVLTWTAASDNAAVNSYTIDVRTDGEKVDELQDYETNTGNITNLSPEVEYSFRLYAMDETGNQTSGPDISVMMPGSEGDGVAEGINGTELRLDYAGYTWCNGEWENPSKIDMRIRGYNVYAHGELVQKIYNYQINRAYILDKIDLTLKRLTPGVNNEVTIKAFLDNGYEYEIGPAFIQTLPPYTWYAPEWPEGSAIEVTDESMDGQVALRWGEVDDAFGIHGYRLYVDGYPVEPEGVEPFNHVNGSCTTKEQTWTLQEVDRSVAHTIKVEAADAWWRALNGSGPFHWTFSGPEIVLESQN